MISLDELVQPTEAADFKRDRWGRPSIMQPNGKRKGYTRCSSAAKTIEDTFNLEKWARRNVAYGMANDASLVARVLAIGGAPGDWDKAAKDEINAIVEAAAGVAKAHKAADIGTAVHRLTERLDRGEDVNGGPYQADLDAYTDTLAAAGFTRDRRYIECRIVNDDLEMAGTADRIVCRADGTHAIADIKTSASVDFGGLGWAAQLAAYAYGHLYDVDAEQRVDTPDVDKQVGYLIHLPAGRGVCTIYEIDIVAGLAAAKLANEIRATRKASKQWITPMTVVDTPTLDKADLMHRYKVLAAQDPVFEDKWRELDIPKGDLAAVEAALLVFERPANTQEMSKRIRANDPKPAAPPVDDEGGEADPGDVNTCKARFEVGMTAEQKAWVGAVVKEAIAANVDFRVTVKATQRRADIYSGLTKYVTSDHWDPSPAFDGCVRALLYGASGDEAVLMPAIALGNAVGAMNVTEARTFRTLVDQLLDEQQILVADEATGTLRLAPAA